MSVRVLSHETRGVASHDPESNTLETRGQGMTEIRQEDFVASVAGALQYISYYPPVPEITSLAKAYEREQSPAARDDIAQILITSRLCAEGIRPICQVP